MAWLRPLQDLDVTDLHEVGHKAFYLSLLARQGLPVAHGHVLTTAVWRHSLSQMPWSAESGDRLTQLRKAEFQTLQQTSQQWQRMLLTGVVPDRPDPPLPAGPREFLPAAWMLRASLLRAPLPAATEGLPPVDYPSDYPTDVGSHGLLAAHIEADLDTLLQQLPHFWCQALTARCLTVWQEHYHRLSDIGLATLIMPVYPALVSGTLAMNPTETRVAAVAGLGLALTQGEAIPARCQISPGTQTAPTWEAGFQERLYQLLPASKYRPHQQVNRSAIQTIRRDRPEIHELLSQPQLDQLLHLATAAQVAFGSAGVQLEWLLYPGADPETPNLVITQASPWPLTPAETKVPPRPPDRTLTPLLPTTSTVVRGIGAASGRVQGRAVVAGHPQDLPIPLPPRAIVVVPDLQPDVFLQLDTVAGVVTERGGATCHAAILARELGIPAVVGAPQATQLLDNGMAVWLDGDRGVVYGFSSDNPAEPSPPSLASGPADFGPAESGPSLPEDPVTRYGQLTTRVMVNLSQTRRLSTLPLDLIAGVGLLRSEWLLLDVLEGRHPWDWVNRNQEADLQSRIVQQLEPILQALGSKPVRYRSLDLRSHEWQALQGSPPVEPNPMLGLRGTLSYNIDDRLFQVELAALATLQRAGYTNLQLILPFVRTVEEVIACRQMIQRAALTDYEEFALWIMAEVPSVLFLLPAYARAGVQGVAIGSNDLIQLLLAVDRDQPTMASAYDEQHPVVRLAIAHLVQEARRCGLLCSICGQAPVRHPELIADLVAWGISSISVESTALPFTLEAVWQTEQGGGE